jgi:EF hand
MKKTITLFIIPLAVIAFSSCKTTTSPPSEDRFAKADTNHDGKLIPTEASDYFVTSVFDGRDVNHDGNLTWDEWTVPGSGRSKANFDAADTNKDSSLSLDEALAYGRKRGVFKEEFQEADTNHDGYVTREEAKAYYASQDNPPLSKAGSIWIADARRDNGNRFVVRADEKLTAFLELQSAIL